MKKIVIFALGLVLTFSACSDFASVGDLDKVVSDLDSLSQRLTDLETRVAILEDLDISSTVLAIETMQGNISTNLDSIDALQERLIALESELDNNAGSGDASTVFWGDVRTVAQYEELAAGNYTKITGNVDVNSIDDVALLQSIDYIGSDLNISDIAGDVEFAALENISGSIIIGDIAYENISTLSFPSLKFINGNLYTNRDSHGLESISCPQLTAVMGDFSMTFSNANLSDKQYYFNQLDIPSLQMIGEEFNLSMTLTLETIEVPVVYVGGDFSIIGNSSLLIAHSDISKVEYIGGSLTIGANFTDEIVEDLLVDAVMFDNLVTVGGSISLSGSADIYKLSGFSKLESIPGSLILQSASLMLGHDTDVKIFDALQTIDGDLYISMASTHIVFRSDDAGATPSLYGFGSLISIGTDVYLSVDQIRGFDKLEQSGSEKSEGYHPTFQISASTLPTFPSFVQVAQPSSTLEITTKSKRVVGLFPALTQGEVTSPNSLYLKINLINTGEIQTISGGFEQLQTLGSLDVTNKYRKEEMNPVFAAGYVPMVLEDGFLSNLVNIQPMSIYSQDDPGYPEHFNLDVSEDTDLSVFAKFFKAKIADKVYADSAWVADSIYYDDMLAAYNKGSIDEDALNGAIPERKDLLTDNIDIYRWEQLDNVNYYTHYTEEKLAPDDDKSALIQCFMHFGDLQIDDSGYLY